MVPLGARYKKDFADSLYYGKSQGGDVYGTFEPSYPAIFESSGTIRITFAILDSRRGSAPNTFDVGGWCETYLESRCCAIFIYTVRVAMVGTSALVPLQPLPLPTDVQVDPMVHVVTGVRLRLELTVPRLVVVRQ